MLRRLAVVSGALATLGLCAGCGSVTPAHLPDVSSAAPRQSAVAAHSSGSAPSRTPSRTPSGPPTSGSSTPSAHQTTHPTTKSAASSSSRPGGRQTTRQLPRGGTTLLGRMRIVAYYGASGTAALGVLGATSPSAAAQAVIRRAASYRSYGEPVQPAMELIATVAQASPGPDGDYSNPVPVADIERYLHVAQQNKMLLILDLQPGRASFLSQAEHLEPFLRDPSVELALDPEWKVTSGAPGGGRIGSSSASGINAVGAWLSQLVTRDHLPDKLLVVHEFTPSMLPDRSHITQHHGVEMVLHADGFGTPQVKINVFHQLAFPHPPFGIGFKLFLRQDTHLMSPAQVMALRPRPDVITYE